MMSIQTVSPLFLHFGHASQKKIKKEKYLYTEPKFSIEVLKKYFKYHQYLLGKSPNHIIFTKEMVVFGHNSPVFSDASLCE